MPLTGNRPKCLVEINGISLLGFQLKVLSKYGINDILITTGPHKKQIESFVEKKFPFLRVKFVNNDQYATTNYIYSMWLLRSEIDSDLLLMHGDMLFDPILLKSLLEFEGNYVLVNNRTDPNKKDFKAAVEKDRVTRIGVNLSGKNTFFMAPVYRFSQSDFFMWMTEIQKFVSMGKVTCYAEDALNSLLQKVHLVPIYYSLELCMEIDTLEDLKRARASPKVSELRFVLDEGG